MRIAETENLFLREFEADDAAELFRIYSDPQTMRFLGKGPETIEAERQNISNHIDNYYKTHGFGLWGVILKSEKRLIGRAGLLLQDVYGPRQPEISYLRYRKFCGKGLATEAVGAVIEIASAKFGIKQLIAVIALKNLASIRVAEKCGFSFERSLETFKDFGPVSVYSREI